MKGAITLPAGLHADEPWKVLVHKKLTLDKTPQHTTSLLYCVVFVLLYTHKQSVVCSLKVVLSVVLRQRDLGIL